MCGIAGYVGNDSTEKVLCKMLEGVEYRGYDSCGMATLCGDAICIKKTLGGAENIKPMISTKNNSSLGIAHTRWATHGGVNIANAHPHISSDQKWAIVHNGIIENYVALKEEVLGSADIKFASETDTEVIVQLLQKYEQKDPLKTIKCVCEKLVGTYALAIINTNTPHQIFVAKKGSPLYIAQEKCGGFVASDPICFGEYASNYFALEDNEFAVVYDKSIEVFDKNLIQIDKKPQKSKLCLDSFCSQNFDHFMQKEILETHATLKTIAKEYGRGDIFKRVKKSILKTKENVILIGCGTAYHAGLMGERFIERFAHVSARTYIASEFRYMRAIVPKNTIAILVSQSGETADTLGAMNELKNRGIKTIALTNVTYSTLAKSCDYVFPLFAGTEKAVASTKAYTAQIAILYLFAHYLYSVKNNNESFLPTHLLSCDSDYPKDYFMPLVKDILKAKNVFFLGRDVDYITVTEASLKLKEISYINSSSYPAGELKHGFLALVDSDTLSIFLCTSVDLLPKIISSIHEVHARGGKTVLITNLKALSSDSLCVDRIIYINDFGQSMMPITSIKFFQWLAYYTSITLGINPDKPKNLAKSVTVE